MEEQRRYLLIKWNGARKEVDHWKDINLCEQAETQHHKFPEQQKLTRKLSRQANAQLEQRTKERLKEECLDPQSRSIKKGKGFNDLRQAEAAQTGQQLNPAYFTNYMGEHLNRNESIKPS